MRAITRDEIKALARKQMAENGTASLSLGAIARAMDLTPSALYRYYASRDDLITALIIDAYNALADALEAAADARPRDDYAGRMLATSLAYRAWALEHPVDFLLLFGNPIPGYQVLAEQTKGAAERVFDAFLVQMQVAYDAGALRPDEERYRLAPEMCPESHDVQRNRPYTPVVDYTGVACWSKLHGMVMLELTGYLPSAVGDAGRFYYIECVRLQTELNITPPDAA
jgi:AcrR family transcriptional regulator